jgi:serine/threonine protein kinase
MAERYWPERRVNGLEGVWYATDQTTGEGVIMKRIDKKHGIDTNLNQRVFREAKALKDLSAGMPSRIIGFR